MATMAVKTPIQRGIYLDEEPEAQHEAHDTGVLGEEVAARYLTDKGYVIVEKNYRKGKYEIDLIAYKDGELVVVEVKTRSAANVILPEEAVDHRKRKALIRIANEYVQSHNRSEAVRFDIVSIVKSGSNTEVRHLENAFNIMCY